MSVLQDGFSTLITFALAPSVALKEKTVTPPGVDGGGEVDTTTMHNTEWRTRNPKKLKTLSESSFTAAYDPAAYDDIVNDLVQKNGLITITFPDGSLLRFWGWLDTFEPQEHTEGEQPTAECTIIPSNQNAAFEETAPVYVTPAP